MFQEVSSLFPPKTHPLTIVSDPDGLLADESILSELAEHGFTFLSESDPVLLRHRIESLKPWQPDKPIILITVDSLEAIPYDFWQSGHHIQLSLHDYFPNLAYPLVRELSSYQRARLVDAPLPKTRLGQQATAGYLLHYVFGIHLEDLAHPATLISWLDDYHNSLAPLPPILMEDLLARLEKIPVYDEWPIKELFQNRDVFSKFLQTEWGNYIQRSIGEPSPSSQYFTDTPLQTLLSFDKDTALQDTLPRLIRSGTLDPVEVTDLSTLPVWAKPAILTSRSDRQPRRMAELTEELEERLERLLQSNRWEDWQAIALDWAELTLLNAEGYAPQPASDRTGLVQRLDKSFSSWLQQRYTPLGAQRLPLPHHLHHVPHYLNYRREQGLEKQVLLILDGMSLADWLLIKRTWQSRSPNWYMDEMLLLAQIPTITSISRQALVSGMRPADFATTLQSNREEPRQWKAFWERAGVQQESCAYVSANFRQDATIPELSDPRLRLLCLIDRTIDEIVHGSVLGNADLIATLKVWLDENRNPQHLEKSISNLLERGFHVFVTSDHGHTEATGIGQPNEGILAQTRGRRVRIYSDQHLAQQAQSTFKPSILWENDGLLPENLYAVLPDERGAFVSKGESILTHGGATIDEVIVPFIEIKHG
jgi:hypothetical protein